MIEIKRNNIEQGMEMKRRGFAYMPHGQKMNMSQEIRLKKHLVLRNRSGIVAASDNVYETLFDQKASQFEKHNYVFFGRGGTGDYVNANYMEFTATVDNEKPPSSQNGQATMTVVQDGEIGSEVPSVGVYDARKLGGAEGDTAVILLGNGSDGAVYLCRVAGNQAIPMITISNDGNLYMSLPTSDPGVSGAAWNDSGTVKISP